MRQVIQENYCSVHAKNCAKTGKMLGTIKI